MNGSRTWAKPSPRRPSADWANRRPTRCFPRIKYFRHEYEAHIRDKECPAGVCRRLAGAPCQKGCPAGIDVPSYVALTASGHYEQALEIVRADNPFPSVCGRICNHGCEVTCTRGEVDSPIAIMQLETVPFRFRRNPAPGPAASRFRKPGRKKWP